MICYLDKLESPIGIVHLAATDKGLVYCAASRNGNMEMYTWLNKSLPEYTLKEGSNEILDQTKTQLKAYFSGKNKVLDVPLQLIGTDFRKTVWEALCTIPYGETKTYGEIAAQIGKPKAARAVGQANHHNPISYFVP